MTIVRAGLVAMMLLTSLACGSSLDNHTGTGGGAGVNTGQAGTGGTQSEMAGTTGTGAMGGTAGTGSGGAPPVPPPRCLLDLIATCPLAGACQYAVNGYDQQFCFAGGETVSVDSIPGGTAPLWVTEVRRSDGTLCYSIERRCGTLCESYAYTWKDAAGTVLAHGMTYEALGPDPRSATTTCAATGETCNVSTPSNGLLECVTPAVTSPTEGLGCTQGSCP